MFNRKENLERKLRVVTAGVTSLAGAGALVHLLNQEASPVQAAELPKPNAEQADPAFLDHLIKGKYQGGQVRLKEFWCEDGQFDFLGGFTHTAEAAESPKPMKEQLALTPIPERCHDTDGIDPWVKGTVTNASGTDSFTDTCARELYPSDPYAQELLIEGVCERPTDTEISFFGFSCPNYNATCQDGRCVRQASPTPIPTSTETPTPTPTPKPKEKIYIPLVTKSS